jgi:hypothetical protein
MSAMSKLKKKVGYETNIPRCKTCTNFREAKIVLIKNSKTKRINHCCAKHGFTIAINSVCDTWLTETGESLEHAHGIKEEV